MEKKRYVNPKAVVKSMSAIDGILYVSGPGGDPNSKAENVVDKDGNRLSGVSPAMDFDAKENTLGFSDDWFDYDCSSDL